MYSTAVSVPCATTYCKSFYIEHNWKFKGKSSTQVRLIVSTDITDNKSHIMLTVQEPFPVISRSFIVEVILSVNIIIDHGINNG